MTNSVGQFMGSGVSSAMLSYTLLGLASLASGYMPFPKFDEHNPPPDCEDLANQVNTYVYFYSMSHPQELELKELLKPTFFQSIFGRAEDPNNYLKFQENGKPKTLYLVSQEDPNEALHPKHVQEMLKQINQKTDLKYQGVRSVGDICYAVKQASETGILKNIIISAHSDAQGMCLSKCQTIKGWMHKFGDYTDCFKGLDPRGKIFLFGSRTGAPTEGGNLAQKIANDAKREVVASQGMIYANRASIPDTKDLELYHENNDNWFFSNWFLAENNQMFQLFPPQYQTCSSKQKSPHPREKAAAEEVKTETLAHSTLTYPETYFEEYVTQICEDNPKSKFLFLSMEYDWNGGLDPEHIKEKLEKIAKHYDLKYQLVSTYNEMCAAIEEAADLGEVLNLVLHGHGNQRGMSFLGNLEDPKDWIDKNQDLSCFNRLAPSAKIHLMSCCVGVPDKKTWDANNNFAHVLAKKTGREVIAACELSSGLGIKIQSIEPFEIFEESSVPEKKAKGDNIFKTFNPKRADTDKENPLESGCYKEIST